MVKNEDPTFGLLNYSCFKKVQAIEKKVKKNIIKTRENAINRLENTHATH